MKAEGKMMNGGQKKRNKSLSLSIVHHSSFRRVGGIILGSGAQKISPGRGEIPQFRSASTQNATIPQPLYVGT
jgi:hypothetical protein